MEVAPPAYQEDLIAALGSRYRFAADGVSLEQRPAKETFRPAGIRAGAAGRIEVDVTVRCTSSAGAGEDAEAARLIQLLEERTMVPRRLSRISSELLEMRSAAGAAAGTMTVLCYSGSAPDAGGAAELIRTLTEGLERTLVAGVHAEDDVTATCVPPPPAAPPPRRGTVRFDLQKGLLGGRWVVVDLDEGTLRTFARRALSTRETADAIRVQSVVAVAVRPDGGGWAAVAMLKEGGDRGLGTGQSRPVVSRAARELCDALRCRFEEG